MFEFIKALEGHSSLSVVASCKTYSKVITTIANAWEQAFGEPLLVVGETPTQRFENVVDQLRNKFRSSSEIQKLLGPLDVETPAALKELLARLSDEQATPGRVQDMDDLTPNQVKQAIREIATEMGSDDGAVDVAMNVFLRRTLDRVAESASVTLVMNIGANRHFPRLIQWVRECEEETVWDDGQGIRIKNASGRGRVAQSPTDPKTLKVTINRAFL